MLPASLLGFLAIPALGSSFSTRRYVDHIVHESRGQVPSQWMKRSDLPIDPGSLLPLRIGLRQQNLHRLYEFIDSVSNPQSEAYGQHWTPEQVNSAFRPTEESVTAVADWLLEVGISNDRIETESSQLWISVNTTVAEAESLLKTKYHVYHHQAMGHSFVACEESYSLPRVLSEEHVDLIMPTLHFNAPAHMVAESGLGRRGESAEAEGKGYSGAMAFQEPVPGPLPATSDDDLSNCASVMAPPCLRALYGYTEAPAVVEDNSFAVIEFSPLTYLTTDMDLLLGKIAPALVGQRPIEVGIDGGAEQPQILSFQNVAGPALELPWSMALVTPQNVTLLQAGDNIESATFNSVLDAFDASYCTFDGGDDPAFDPVYPDLQEGGYNGTQDCGTVKPPAVLMHTISLDEADLTPFYMQRQCNEFGKLGLMGTTVLHATSLFGVAGIQNLCLDKNGTLGPSTGRFNPTFPGTCPYVTSVGVTQLTPGVNFTEALEAGQQPEQALYQINIGPTQSNGGGFSNVFQVPEYQEEAVKSFLDSQSFPCNGRYFNSSGKARAFPDVSANGVHFPAVIGGEQFTGYGVAESTIVFSSIISRINTERLLAGKSTVGFVNPVLYANPGMLRDVTDGQSFGCVASVYNYAFQATEGWDPVTGLGTPDYPSMLEVFMSLP